MILLIYLSLEKIILHKDNKLKGTEYNSVEELINSFCIKN